MGIDVNALKSVDLFAELKPEELDRIAAIAETTTVCEGEIFMRRGEPAHTLFVVLTGNYLIYFQGNRSFSLHHKGNVIGWSTVVSPHKYTGSGVALTKGSLIAFSGEQLQRMLEKDSVLKDKIMKKINNIVAERMIYVKDAATDDNM